MSAYPGQLAVNVYLGTIGRKLDYSDAASIGNIVYGYGKETEKAQREVERFLKSIQVSLKPEEISELIATVKEAIGKNR